MTKNAKIQHVLTVIFNQCENIDTSIRSQKEAVMNRVNERMHLNHVFKLSNRIYVELNSGPSQPVMFRRVIQTMN